MRQPSPKPLAGSRHSSLWRTEGHHRVGRLVDGDDDGGDEAYEEDGTGADGAPGFGADSSSAPESYSRLADAFHSVATGHNADGVDCMTEKQIREPESSSEDEINGCVGGSLSLL